MIKIILLKVNTNSGLAHGVLGPMSLFALCMAIKGITIENLSTHIKRHVQIYF